MATTERRPAADSPATRVPVRGTAAPAGEVSRPLWLRLTWMVLIWASSVAALGAVAGLLRLVVPH